MSRPRKEIDLAQLVNLARIHCTAEECASFFGISTDTLDRRLKEAGEGGFAEFHKTHSGEGKASLRREQWRVAQKGNPTMLIWLGKQWLGQRDHRDLTHGGTGAGGAIGVTFRTVYEADPAAPGKDRDP